MSNPFFPTCPPGRARTRGGLAAAFPLRSAEAVDDPRPRRAFLWGSHPGPMVRALARIMAEAGGDMALLDLVKRYAQATGGSVAELQGKVRERLTKSRWFGRVGPADDDVWSLAADAREYLDLPEAQA